MPSLLLALALGLSSGLALTAAARIAWLGWLMLAPLCAAVYLLPPPLAGLAGLVAGVMTSVPDHWVRLFPKIEFIVLASTGVVWGASCAVAAWAWSDGVPAWGVLVFPLCTVTPRWAKDNRTIAAAGLIDRDLKKNQMIIADESGAIAVTCDKQHPVPGAKSRRQVRMPPTLLERDGICVSGVICVDLDHFDLVRPDSRAGGVLVAP